MLVVLVNVSVVQSGIDAFIHATELNARASIEEPGIARFDVIQQQNDPTRFVLVEVYRDNSAPAAHKQTQHYKTWREAVEPLMAAPRVSHKYVNLQPADAGWETSGR